MKKEEIYDLIEMFERGGLTVFEYEDGEARLRLEKNTSAPAPSVKDTQQPQKQEEAPTPQDTDISVIKAPIVGIFYRASTPGSSPLVELGQKVQKGDVICIVEAMKVMNEIKAEFDCIIQRVVAVDGEMVDVGKTLFEVKKC